MFKGVNRVMRAYIYWDLVINSAWGLLSPIFAIFILQTIAVGNIARGAEIVGFATLFYWVTKSILQIPIGNYLDKNHGEIDDFWFYIIGTIITALVPFGFLFSYLPWHIYALQILHATGMSMIIPSSYAIFIRHTDKGREAYESGLDSTLFGIGAGITGAVGGIMVGYLGFKLIFILTGTFTLISLFFIFPVRKDMLPRVPRKIHEFPVEKNILP
ncbi:MAG: hypothetical protein A3C58_02230 [Candidatus Staskawiczbacteria bacterium RIFCSPHIGHO2_02_FULL_34_10]|uniref:Major facilitator superfamily (MFS) profile domain-containing protein n=1 Tax=Candidatus Staskawiczbacteria bacterium RIFCSPHIGHO2_02_FULL_34_10 TaxID=1802205 RepID=A0A1G2HYC6_9BACT|nr:MAG: hypothetical protein A3C58_02230 [Candidatus Staskawiczbacteria bacterium RIFCSPHIGHO2_02_FULL_34_10]